MKCESGWTAIEVTEGGGDYTARWQGKAGKEQKANVLLMRVEAFDVLSTKRAARCYDHLTAFSQDVTSLD